MNRGEWLRVWGKGVGGGEEERQQHANCQKRSLTSIFITRLFAVSFLFLQYSYKSKTSFHGAGVYLHVFNKVTWTNDYY